MIKQTVKYTNYNGEMVEEDLYFNLTRLEMMDMEMDEHGAMSQRIDRMKKAKDARAAYYEVKEIVIKSFGIRSEDGKYFHKNEKIREDFLNSAAYDEFFMSLFGSTQKVTDFVNGIVPAEAIKKAMEDAEAKKIQLDDERPKPTSMPVPEKAKENVGTFGQSLPAEHQAVMDSATKDVNEKLKDMTPEEMRAALANAGYLK